MLSQHLLIPILEVDNPAALQRFFNLMLAVLRVINAVVLSRGPQNDHTMLLARDFLKDNRPSIVGVFKRNARLGGRKVDDEADLNDLVDQFTLLISATQFLEVRLLCLHQYFIAAVLT
jgi:nuclear pore complex protein Nup205